MAFIYGTTGNDTRYGSSAIDYFYLYGGNDTAYGNAGADFMYGYEGDDSLFGGTGNDYIYGGTGNDTIDGGYDKDYLYGGDGDDTFVHSGNGWGANTYGGTGIDVLDLSITTTTGWGTGGMYVNLATSTYSYIGNNSGANGSYAITGIESVKGTALGDRMFGRDDTAEAFVGNGGNDELYGGGGNDSLFGGAGDDDLTGGAGRDILKGGVGSDELTIVRSSDLAAGEEYNGGGGAGSDELEFEDGDSPTNHGSDTYDLRGVTLANFEEIDINSHGSNTTVEIIMTAQQLADGFTSDAKFNMGGSSGQSNTITIDMDMLTSLDMGDLTFSSATAGQDYMAVEGTAGADTVGGSSIADIIMGYDGNDVILGRDGDDQIISGRGNDVVRGGAGQDTLSTAAGNDKVFGGTGDDMMVGGKGDDRLVGGADNDKLFGMDDDDKLFGSIGNDRLHGQNGEDVLSGAAGQDILNGGRGRDVMTGGADADRFIFNNISDSQRGGANRDVITDFTTGVDTIDLSTLDANKNVAGNQAFTYLGTGGFSGAGGEVRAQVVNGTDILLQMDINGAAPGAEMEILLQDAAGIGGSDFIL